jgi:hypothetical protein
VVLSGGSFPLDVLQALPAGRYVSIAIRFAARRQTAPPGITTGRAVYTMERGTTELRFSVPGARQVDLVGDWTAWRPVALDRAADGRWTLRVTLTPGVYRFNLVVDGDAWIAPPGVAAVDDGFGGKTGLLVVP